MIKLEQPTEKPTEKTSNVELKAMPSNVFAVSLEFYIELFS